MTKDQIIHNKPCTIQNNEFIEQVKKEDNLFKKDNNIVYKWKDMVAQFLNEKLEVAYKTKLKKDLENPKQ